MTTERETFLLKAITVLLAELGHDRINIARRLLDDAEPALMEGLPNDLSVCFTAPVADRAAARAGARAVAAWADEMKTIADKAKASTTMTTMQLDAACAASSRALRHALHEIQNSLQEHKCGFDAFVVGLER